MSQVYKDIIRLTIDLKTGVEETILPIKQSDNLSRVLRCQLKNNNKPINLKGSQLILYVVKADKTLSMINGVINQAKVGLVDFELTEQSLALVDEIQCEIVKIDGNNVKLSFPIFKVKIEDSIYDEGLIESQHEFSALTALISNVAGWDNKFTTMYEDLETKLDSEIAKTNAQLSKKVGGGTLANMSDLGQDIKEALLIPGTGIPVVDEDSVNIVNLGSDLKTYYAKNLLKQSMVQINKALYGVDNKDKNCINGTHLWDNVGTSVISYIPVNSKVYDIVFKYNGNLALNTTRMTILGYNSEGYPTSRLDTIEAGKITVPTGTSYICLQTNSDFDFTNLFIVEHFDGIDYSKIEDVYLKFLMKSDVGMLKSKLYGKKVAVLGDSITGTDYVTPTWWQMIAKETGCTVTNYGVSGTSIAFNEDREQFGKCFAERYTSMADNFDIIFVMGGTNDRGRTVLGNWRDTDISTMYGALNTLIKGLIDKYPDATILFATPIQEKVSWDSNYKFDATQYFFNEVQSTTVVPSVQYISEAIKVKCRQYAIPCKNLFDESRITGYNESDWLDALHPSASGQNKLKVAIQNFLENSI